MASDESSLSIIGSNLLEIGKMMYHAFKEVISMLIDSMLKGFSWKGK